jgi:murein DD-endopeptidase MepM/ murein hydrolase activator NlpD
VIEMEITSPQGIAPSSPPASSASDTRERAQIVRLAEEFESMLVLQMLRQMRASMLDEKSEDNEGMGADVFTDTFDQEVARHLSQVGGFGLKPIIVQAFERSTRGVGSTTSTGPVGVHTSPEVATTPVLAAPASVEGTGTPHAADGDTPDLVAGQVTSAFGWRSDPFHGRSKFHAGVDLKAAYGRPVPVVSDGTVSFAGEQGAYGLTVVVDHGGGLTTRYAHLSSLDVESGERLSAGQVLGLVGQSGRATGPHLHFEVRQGGEVIDPGQAGTRFEAAGLKLVPLDVD